MKKHTLGVKRTFYLYFRFMKMNLKALLGFQADFIIMLVASAFTQLLGIIFLWVIYQRIPEINGWEFWEVAFIYAMIFFTEGFASLLFEGCWTFSGLVNRGELDRMLIRPISPVLQILSSRIGINGVSNIVIGTVIIIQALQHVEIQWTVGKLLMTILLIISGIVIRGAINFASNSSAFWTNSPGNSFGFMVHSICDFAKYPINIYSFGLQVFITAIVPYAFIGFFPATFIFEKEQFGYWGMLSPVVAIYSFWLALWIFYRGLKRYESTGN